MEKKGNKIMEKKGNSTWVNLDDIRSLFSAEEIEARKKEILEEMELKRKKDFAAKELMKQERQEKKDKGWTSSAIGQELRINPPVDDIVSNIIEEVLNETLPPIPEPPKVPEDDPKAAEIIRLKEQLAALKAMETPEESAAEREPIAIEENIKEEGE